MPWCVIYPSPINKQINVIFLKKVLRSVFYVTYSEEKVLRSAFYIIHRVRKWEGEVCVSITSGTRKAGGRIEYVCVLGLEVQKRSEGVY